MGATVPPPNEPEEPKVWDIAHILLFSLVKFDKIEILNMELNWNKISANNVIQNFTWIEGMEVSYLS